LDQAIEFLASQGLRGEEKYKVLSELVDEGKVKMIEDKIGNILFVVSDTPKVESDFYSTNDSGDDKNVQS